MLCYVEFSKPINDYCQVTSLSFGMNSDILGNTNRSAQRHGLSFSKALDSLSPALSQACAMGTEFNTVWVEYYKDEDSDCYMAYTLSGVVVAAYQTLSPGENVSLDYRAMKAEYYGR